MGWRTQLQEMVPAGVPIAVLGVGSVLCGDDAAGMEVIARLEQYDLPGRILLCAGSTAPENFTGVIKKFAPTYLIVIDAAYMEKPPGTIAIIPAEAIDGMGFSTHMLPMSVMLNYLRQELQMEVICIGIKPQSTEFGSAMGSVVEAAVNQLTDALHELCCG